MSLKKNSKFSIKAKLLSAIIPITSAMIIVLVVIAYNVSASMIKRMPKNFWKRPLTNKVQILKLG